MDILQPKLVQVEDRCYRFCDSTVWSSAQSKTPYQEDYYQQDYDKMNNEECADVEIPIELASNGTYKHTFYVEREFYKFIIGTQGKTKQKIEAETQTWFTVPRADSKHMNIVICGKTRANVISCRQRIDLVIESSKNKIRFTHFISIPLNTESIMMNYKKFKDNILNDSQCESKGVFEELFVNEKKLHLTIGMLRLLNEKDKSAATTALSICVEEVIKPILLSRKQPITIRIQGLNYMNDDSSQVSVLYAEVVKNDVLQEIVDKTFEYFMKQDLVNDEHFEKVKLHMTLMKSKRSIKYSLSKRGRDKFDATKITKDYKDYFFGETFFNAINISKISKAADSKGYEILKEINLSLQ